MSVLETQYPLIYPRNFLPLMKQKIHKHNVPQRLLNVSINQCKLYVRYGANRKRDIKIWQIFLHTAYVERLLKRLFFKIVRLNENIVSICQAVTN